MKVQIMEQMLAIIRKEHLIKSVTRILCPT